jgi:hypothetical protein
MMKCVKVEIPFEITSGRSGQIQQAQFQVDS